MMFHGCVRQLWCVFVVKQCERKPMDAIQMETMGFLSYKKPGRDRIKRAAEAF